MTEAGLEYGPVGAGSLREACDVSLVLFSEVRVTGNEAQPRAGLHQLAGQAPL